MEQRAIGIVAHVDAGKTTLAEALLYTTGKIKTLGRVDKRSTFLDNHTLERERGITIFSKQARFSTARTAVTLLDTPGHVDFSAEAERTLSVLDAAILVISGAEGVQAHTETMWRLLARYRLPTFFFVTKMDLPGGGREAVMAELVREFGAGCIDFGTDRETIWEAAAMTDEAALEQYAEHGNLCDAELARLVAERRIFPCFFGSGLRLEGIEPLLDAIDRFTRSAPAAPSFGARVYKITHDRDGTRLCWLRLTGGSLALRDTVRYTPPGGGDAVEEKITAIRLYSGERYTTAERVDAGEICAVAGLSMVCAGQGLGCDAGAEQPLLEPIRQYRLTLPAGVDARLLLPRLRRLEEEEPMLRLVWDERYGEIHAQMMGQVQTEVLCRLIADRYGVEAGFADGRIMYRETVTAPVEGIGHFEPLRHYAEVHLLIEPAPAGSGVTYDCVCSTRLLERNWQRLVLSSLEEKRHLGVLTGSPLTDVRITLVSGRAHLKHTGGGDFREAAWRAVRQGLMRAAAAGQVQLLEPCYAFRLSVPGECVGRAISDIVSRSGSVTEQETEPGVSVLTGRVPVASLGDYGREVAAYTHGRGKLSCRVEGYFPCHNPAEVIAEFSYDPTADLDNTPDSVFCAHGAGFIVPWERVPEYMHLEGLRLDAAEGNEAQDLPEPRLIARNLDLDEKALEALMEREFGPIRRPIYGDPKKPRIVVGSDAPRRRQFFIVDGYNVIFAWDELAALARQDLEGARTSLCDILANYRAFTGRELVVVFDAYHVKHAAERVLDHHGVTVVYTKENEPADAYIERMTANIGRDYAVRVVTSDGLIQLQTLRAGLLRMSAREFREEIIAADQEIAEILAGLVKDGE